MTINAFMQRFIALIACLCLAASGTGVAWAQAGAGTGISFVSSDLNNNSDIRLFLAQADTASLGFDITAPTISHTPSDTPGIAGEMQTIVAQISDNQSVARALLRYRNSSADTYSTTEMSADTSTTTWMATVDTTTEDAQVFYYIVAEDSDGNRVQKGSAGDPLTLTLQQPQVFSTVAPVKRDNRRTWLGIGLGVAAAAILILATGGGGGGGGDNNGIVNSDDDNNCCTITFTVPNVTTEP